jgi:tungstate transport system ATP-binding protein
MPHAMHSEPLRQRLLPLCATGLTLTVDGLRLLDDLNFEITAGGATVILGPNGAGKTLLLKICHGLMKPSGGKVFWADGQSTRPTRQHALVFQRPVLLRRTVRANIDYVLRLDDGMSRDQRLARVAEMLRITGLGELSDRPARALSGGEQQRLALSRAWALTPEVMFLDEPTANLDPAATRAVEELIAEIQAAGTTIVLSTHDLAQARRLASAVLFIHRGRLIEHAPAEQFFNAPATPEAKAFVRGELLWQ